MLQTDRDNIVIKEAKTYIENKLKKGDPFTTSMIQRYFKTGYMLANRVLDALEEDGYIKIDENRLKAPKVVFNYA